MLFQQRRAAVTLIEVIIAVAVILLVISISVVAVQQVRTAAAQAQCANQLKQLGLACHAAHDQHKRMPPAFGFYPEAELYSGSTGLGTVFFHLLPQLDLHPFYQQARHRPTPSPGQRQQDFFFYTAHGTHQKQVALFNCPADPSLRPDLDAVTGAAFSSYAANYLVFGNVEGSFANKNAQGTPRLASTFRDGTSNTILFAEKYASAWDAQQKGGCHWGYFQATCHNPLIAYYEPGYALDPLAISAQGTFQVKPKAEGGCNPCLPATGHPTMNVCLADASVRPLAVGIDPAAWWALITPAAGDAARP